VGEEDGNINFFRNTGTPTNPFFTFETENFASINLGFGDSAPTFADIDNDGDFDLFVGENDGNINFFRNTGTATDPTFTLETEIFGSVNVGSSSAPTFADIDNDGDLDLFVGEEEFDDEFGEAVGAISFFRNTGTTTVTFPTFTLETETFAGINGTAPTFADIDNDGDLDLFVGRGDGNINFFRNTGTPTNPTFTLETSFFADIDVGDSSIPTFADIDNDGDFDLFVGEQDGNINFYRNTGTPTNPTFTLETANLASIKVGHRSAPTFADIDSDGDFDLFVGDGDSNINFYRNTGTPTNPIFTLETENFVSIDLGRDSHPIPTLADIDNDGDFDLFVGESDGNINFFLNRGTATNANFTFLTENFADINVGDFSASAPTFADIDNGGDLDLFVGDGNGNINFFRNTGTATATFFTFTLETENLVSIDVGRDSKPTFADIDNDRDFDLFVGEEGNINFFRNTGTATNPIFTLDETFFEDDEDNEDGDVEIALSDISPTVVDIDNDGDLDAFVGEERGDIYFFRNTGTPTDPIFTFEIENFVSTDVEENSTPTFADIDNDGDFDLFVGGEAGNINFFRNTGTATNPIFTLEAQNFTSINVGRHSAPTFADIDNDGDFDLFVGESDGNINFFRNTGTATEPIFTLETDIFISIDVGRDSHPIFADIDNDGDYDLFVGEQDGSLHFYRNITPDKFDVAGIVKYAITDGPVKGATITLSGGDSTVQTTDANGNYLFNNLQEGLNYTVTPSKDDDISPLSISCFDASLAFQHFLSLITLHPQPQTPLFCVILNELATVKLTDGLSKP